MTLQTLEQSLTKCNQTCIRRNDGTLVWPIGCRYRVHPIILSDEQHGYMKARVSFPVPPLGDLAEFCKQVSEFLPDTLSLDIAGNCRMVHVVAYEKDDGIQRAAYTVALAADSLYPLTEHLCERHSWDKLLLVLGFIKPEGCYGAPYTH
jgi:hypothetical protein